LISPLSLHDALPIFLLAFPIGLVSRSAHAQDPSGTALITGCKSGSTIRGYKRPGTTIKEYARFNCGSSVYVWNANAKTALVQQRSEEHTSELQSRGH